METRTIFDNGIFLRNSANNFIQPPLLEERKYISALKLTATFLNQEESEYARNHQPNPEDDWDPCGKDVKECYVTLMSVYAPESTQEQDKIFFTCVDAFNCESFRERTCMENSMYNIAYVTEKCKEWKLDGIYTTRYKIDLYQETNPPRFPD